MTITTPATSITTARSCRKFTVCMIGNGWTRARRRRPAGGVHAPSPKATARPPTQAGRRDTSRPGFVFFVPARRGRRQHEAEASALRPTRRIFQAAAHDPEVGLGDGQAEAEAAASAHARVLHP